MIGLSSVLSNQVFGSLSEKQLDYLDRISASGDHLLLVIEDLLDMARIEAGRDELQLEPLDLVHEIYASIDMIREEVERNGVAIEGPDRDDSAIVNADRRRLRQILLNLMSNAAKFTSEGGKIGVNLTHADGEARIVIWDTGIGIVEEELSRIFEPFHQIATNLDRPRVGSGLGLALSKQLVEMHDASIQVESSKEGSRFILTWPLSDRETDIHESPPRTAGAPASDLAGMRVLLAEDNEVNRLLARDLLLVAGCKVTEATDGQMALDMARAEPPDVILLDIQLPVVDGLEVARAIRSDDRLSDTPILAVTAMAMAEDLDRIMAAGCDGYLAKPFTRDEFYAAMASLLLEPVSV